ncbi:MAG: hypothetical protein E7632_09135 [Ruminococcaceae bacterium]|nr:hypothetical protein [Oscillospiraceae bacterium]
MQKFFAAANSASGFVSWFDDIFAPRNFTRTYVIKGGSGTGKSTLMKRAAERWEKSGGTAERFYCSSDADSLDGVILTRADKTVAMLDGTSPHIRDPKYPGAADEIIHLGAYWRADALTVRREEIIALADKKSALYDAAYKNLAVAGIIAEHRLAELSPAILTSKLDAAMTRLLTKRMKACRVRVGTSPVRRIRALSAIATQGEVTFDGAQDGWEICLAVDAAGGLPYLFRALIHAADALGLDYDRAPSPLLPDLTEGVMFPGLKLAVLSMTAAKDARPLNMARFVDREALAALDRSRLRGLSRLEREFRDAALAKLAEIRKIHGAMEKIYISAMDFDRMNRDMEKILAEILD